VVARPWSSQRPDWPLQSTSQWNSYRNGRPAYFGTTCMSRKRLFSGVSG